MDKQYYVTFLVAHAGVIRGLAQGLTPEQAHWQPDAGSWSVIEVINHLVDEEVEDFHAHLAGLFSQPIQPWTLIKPQQWATERQYQVRQLEPSLEAFLQARADSLSWLEDLAEPDWTLAYDLPWGRLSAGDLLASWAAHDLLHIRQLAELNYRLLAKTSAPGQIAYAGDW
ncbi:MAG: DinB family protein [Anaerolineaceae bacterium]|nr:DinB family protein [Anaerolineaceae bacterium]